MYKPSSHNSRLGFLAEILEIRVRIWPTASSLLLHLELRPAVAAVELLISFTEPTQGNSFITKLHGSIAKENVYVIVIALVEHEVSN